ncbi:MAG: phytanoyl-CoA dioxygenase family protein [Gemmatimonadetes bacterium]|jgi:phytanoyl-CoA hydroxylase|nr:phytanoyl-CoA dioxygenase family protein [Gemmatimonadota bacterium]MBT7860736.1 phytanoyl-CoA dioxygenase family protein [Gemmatimonadota bacterium]
MSAALEHDADLYSNTAVSTTCPNLGSVDSMRMAAFERDGYVAIERAFSSTRIQAAMQAVDDLIDGQCPDFRGLQYESGHGDKDELSRDERRRAVRKLMSFVDHDPRLHELAFDHDLLALISRLMGDAEPALFQDMALLKPPGGREKPWHQDMAYFDVPVQTPVIGVWIALEPATIENGALRVISGSHKLGPQEHFKRRDWQICDTQIDRGNDMAVPLPAGGALIWHGLLQHGSPGNHSDQRRRALQYHYKPCATPEIPTDDRLAIYGGEVRGAQC